MHSRFIEKDSSIPDRRGSRTRHVAGWMVFGLLATILFALIFGFLVMFLWNWLMPDLFGLKEINYWRAFGLVILAKLLFGGFGPRHHEHRLKHTDRFHAWHKEKSSRLAEGSIPEDFRKNWKYYRQYWEDEGEAAFKAYIHKMETEMEERGDV